MLSCPGSHSPTLQRAGFLGLTSETPRAFTALKDCGHLTCAIPPRYSGSDPLPRFLESKDQVPYLLGESSWLLLEGAHL